MTSITGKIREIRDTDPSFFYRGIDDLVPPASVLGLGIYYVRAALSPAALDRHPPLALPAHLALMLTLVLTIACLAPREGLAQATPEIEVWPSRPTSPAPTPATEAEAPPLVEALAASPFVGPVREGPTPTRLGGLDIWLVWLRRGELYLLQFNHQRGISGPRRPGRAAVLLLRSALSLDAAGPNLELYQDELRASFKRLEVMLERLSRPSSEIETPQKPSRKAYLAEAPALILALRKNGASISSQGRLNDVDSWEVTLSSGEAYVFYFDLATGDGVMVKTFDPSSDESLDDQTTAARDRLAGMLTRLPNLNLLLSTASGEQPR